jgi:hypothetical protein
VGNLTISYIYFKIKKAIMKVNLYNGNDMSVPAKILNEKNVGKNNFLYHLRELNILDANNEPMGIYKSLNFIEKIKVKTKNGISKKLVIYLAGLEYFNDKNIYELVRNESRKYVANKKLLK